MKQLLARFFREVKERKKQSTDAQPIDIKHIAKSGILGAMTGGIVAAYYGIPKDIVRKALDYLSEDMIEVLNKVSVAVNRR